MSQTSWSPIRSLIYRTTKIPFSVALEWTDLTIQLCCATIFGMHCGNFSLSACATIRYGSARSEHEAARAVWLRTCMKHLVRSVYSINASRKLVANFLQMVFTILMLGIFEDDDAIRV